DDDTQLDAALDDPVTERLLIAHTIAYTESVPFSPSNNSEPLAVGLAAAMQKRGVRQIDQADKLAALVYRTGRYDLAEYLADQASGPLAFWVRARLAMQKGNLSEAAKYYSEASKAFPPSGNQNQSGQALLYGENSVLTLSRGEYIDALQQLYPLAATYWGDVAYIAERVLTVNELKDFVDTHAPMPTSSASQSGAAQWLVPNSATQIRNLLARRLVRDGRFQEALQYFSEPTSAIGSAGGDSSAQADPKKQVASYAQALHGGKTASQEVDRARGWYDAAASARRYGMEMMGYETAPDMFVLDGEFAGGVGQSALRPDDPFVSAGERDRFAASEARPDRRYHYRYIAVDEAVHAADLLPPRSQAFAAVLCQATSWIIDGQSCPESASKLRASPLYSPKTPISKSEAPQRQWWNAPDDAGAQQLLTCQLYQRYLRNGPAVPWAAHFGRLCPDPDFAGAAKFSQMQTERAVLRRHRIFWHRLKVMLNLALVAIVVGAGTIWFMRHRVSPPS
ncbi:MAG TPA: hypothetical protein VMT58_01895, partial [Candidatus Binataceae bacterium]|nr:hypothetical protein [Candidatus Binataceae bacterium]